MRAAVVAVAGLIAFALPPSGARAADVPPRDWVDPDTGHRVVRLSADSGGSSLYFHQHTYTPEGDRIVIDTKDGITAVDLSTLGVGTPKTELIVPGGRVLAMAWRTREVYFRSENVLRAASLDTRVVRDVVKLPSQVGTSGALAVNADESLVVGIAPEPGGTAEPRTAPPGSGGGRLEPRWAQGTAMMIYTINPKTGELRKIHTEHDWTNHLQCSPTDPGQILFCHEGPWHFVDRTWTVRTDGSGLRLLHQRTMDLEIEGHEFFSADGRTVWYDLQTPKSGVFWVAGVDLSTGERTRYHLERIEWSVHYNVSRDGALFAGDGGGPASVASRRMDGTTIEPAANGQWIYLFRPVLAKNPARAFPEQKDLTRVGFFQAERLVNMKNHDYQLEPNVTFTPNGKWIVFRSNLHGATHTYAVEIAKSP